MKKLLALQYVDIIEIFQMTELDESVDGSLTHDSRSLNDKSSYDNNSSKNRNKKRKLL
jgi:hypothetical protein